MTEVAWAEGEPGWRRYRGQHLAPQLQGGETVNPKKLLLMVVAVAVGSAIAVLVSTLLGLDTLIPGIVGAIAGAVAVAFISANPQSR